MELVSTSNEGANSISLALPMVKTEQEENTFFVDVEGEFPSESKNKVLASASTSTSNPIFPVSHYVQTTQVALASLGATPTFDPLHEFQLHLEEEYEVSAGIKYSGFKTSGGKKRTQLV